MCGLFLMLIIRGAVNREIRMAYHAAVHLWKSFRDLDARRERLEGELRVESRREVKCSQDISDVLLQQTQKAMKLEYECELEMAISMMSAKWLRMSRAATLIGLVIGRSEHRRLCAVLRAMKANMAVTGERYTIRIRIRVRILISGMLGDIGSYFLTFLQHNHTEDDFTALQKNNKAVTKTLQYFSSRLVAEMRPKVTYIRIRIRIRIRTRSLSSFVYPRLCWL